jgi:hypothetical protein
LGELTQLYSIRENDMASTLVQNIAAAITSMEGANPSLNNPGNIMDYGYYQQTGNFRLQQYPTKEAGDTALDSLISSYISRGYNLNQFFATYAPTGHGANDPVAYANYVSGKIGVDPTTPLTNVSDTGIPTYSVTATSTALDSNNDLSLSSDLASLFGGSDSNISSDVMSGGVSGVSGNGLLIGVGIAGLALLLYILNRN